MSTKYIIVSMFVMALTTYVIRMLPMAIFRKKINDKRVQSFLYYVPLCGAFGDDLSGDFFQYGI